MALVDLSGQGESIQYLPNGEPTASSLIVFGNAGSNAAYTTTLQIALATVSTIRIVTTTGAAPLLSTDVVVSLQIPNASATISLPAPSTATGRKITYKDGLGNANNYPTTFNVTGGALIDGQATFALNVQYQSFSFISDGTQWSVL